MLQAPNGLDTVLFKDGSEVALGHVVGKGAVAEDARGVACRGERSMPCDHAQCQRF